MKQHTRLSIIVTLCGLFITPNVISHPHDAPLTFRKHLTNDGRVIYSNIPKKCFSNGVLTCGDLHPVMGGSALKDTKPGDKPPEK